MMSRLIPCLGCGKPQPSGSRCPSCELARQRKISARQDAQRPGRQQRGYDAEYERTRRAMISLAWEHGSPCILCGDGFSARSDITAQHISGRSNDPSNIGPAHLACNSRDGGRSSRR